MTNPQHVDPPDKGKSAEERGSASETDSPPAVAPEKKKLTAEEQMALYEEHLKETDWGHQPC